MGVLRDLERLLEQVNKEIERNQRNAHYKEIGYSTRCKTCNHPLVEDIERLYNNGYSYEAIINELELEDISIMALSRHFKITSWCCVSNDNILPCRYVLAKLRFKLFQ